MDFKIARGRPRCSTCDRELRDGESYYVGLTASEEEGAFARADHCAKCWEGQDLGALTAWWPAEFSLNKKPALLDPDLLWQVFHAARAQKHKDFSQEEMHRFGYVAALGLMRLKKLKLKGTKRAKGTEFLIFQTPGRKASERKQYEVRNPELNEEAVIQVQDRLAELA